MRSLKRLLHVPKAERQLLFEAAFIILTVCIMLRWLTLGNVQRALADISMGWRSHNACSADRIAWAIQKAASSLADSNCLVQALAGQALLVRYGYESLVTIGVAKAIGIAKDGCDRFAAHAWVTCENEVVIGGHERANYTALLTLGS
jgi:hypothetical protein